MPFLNEDVRQMLDDSAEKFIGNQYDFDNRQKLVESNFGYSAEYWQQFAELGWLAIPFSEEFGGLDGDILDTLGLMRLFGKALVVEPFVASIGLAGQALRLSQNEGQKAALLPQLLAGEAIACLAHEEQGSRGNPACVTTVASKTAAGYHLKGQKIAVLGAPQADYVIVSARISGETFDEQGIGLFLLENPLAGVDAQAYPMVDGHRAANLLLDVELPEDCLLADGAEGFDVLQQAVTQGALMLCAESIGMMQSMVELTAEYLNTRKQFGVPIASFQVLRHRIADMYMAWQAAENLLVKMESELRSGSIDGVLALSLLKAKVGESGRYISQQAVQLHGGMGMTDELIIGHYLKRTTVIEMLMGNTDFHLSRVFKLTTA